jgi:hypothetical protein
MMNYDDKDSDVDVRKLFRQFQKKLGRFMFYFVGEPKFVIFIAVVWNTREDLGEGEFLV